MNYLFVASDYSLSYFFSIHVLIANQILASY